MIYDLKDRKESSGGPVLPLCCSFRILSFLSAEHAKQTQLGWAGPGGSEPEGREVLYKQTQFGRTPAAARRLGPARAGCTKKPNLPPPDGQARPWLEPIAPNKANSGGGHIPLFYCSIIPPFRAKQTQFRAGQKEGQVPGG
jgi:hypothetical protein